MDNEKLSLWDMVLSKYWSPSGEPLWKHHLPSILISTLLLASVAYFKVVSAELIFAYFVVLMVSQFVFYRLAKKRFGDAPPPGTFYSKQQ